MGRKMGKALEDADKRKVDYAVIVGERELKEGAVTLKNLAKREQTVVPLKEWRKRYSNKSRNLDIGFVKKPIQERFYS